MFVCKTSPVRLFVSFFLACLLTALTGCASIRDSKNQPVSVSAVCDGQPVAEASCTLMNDKGSWYVKTLGSVMIQKAYGDPAVDCKKGDAVASTKFKSSSNGGVWGNILAGGIIGYAVDASSDTGFDSPSTMTVTLPPPCGTSAQKIATAD